MGPLAARLLWQCCRGNKGQPREPQARGDLHCQSPRSPLAPGVINSDQLCLCLNMDSHPKDKICIFSEVCYSSPAMSAVHKGCSGTAGPAWHHPRQSPALFTVWMCGFTPACFTAFSGSQTSQPWQKLYLLNSISVLPSMGTIPFVSNLYLSGTVFVGLWGSLFEWWESAAKL